MATVKEQPSASQIDSTPVDASAESSSAAVDMIVTALVKMNESSIQKRLLDSNPSVVVDDDTLCLAKTLWLSVVRGSICASISERVSSLSRPLSVAELASTVCVALAKYQLVA